MVDGNADNPPLSAHQLDMIVEQIQQLPTLPAIAARILSLTSSRSSSANEVVRLIEQDQSLTARVLRLVGRTGGSRRAPGTVKAAVLMAGFKVVRNAVLSVKVFDVFRPERRRAGAAFDRAGFWRHCMAVAVAARMLAEARGGVDPEEAFCAGLLHDLGKVVLDVCLPKTFDRVVRWVASGRHSIAQAEQRLLGVDHATVGRRLAEKWKLPAVLADVIWLHHHAPGTLPPDTRHRAMIELVHVADALAREQRIGFSGNRHFQRPVAEMAEQIGVGAERLAAIRDRLCEETAARAEALGLDSADAMQLYRAALADANEELGRLNEELGELSEGLQQQSRRFELLVRMHQRAAEADSAAATLGAVAGAVQQCTGSGEVHCFAWYEAEGAVQLVSLEPDGPPRMETIHAAPPAAVAAGGFAVLDARLAEPWFFQDRPVPADAPYLSFPLTEAGVRIGGVVFLHAHAGPPCEARLAELAALACSAASLLRRAQVADETRRLAEALAASQRNLLETQEQLLRTRTMASIGEMAAGAAHEINNPLAIISGRAQLLSGEMPDEKQKKHLTTIVEQCARATGIIAELMRFAEPEEPRPMRFDLAALLDEQIGRFERAQEGAVAIERDLPADLPAASADPQQIGVAFDAVLSNACQAVEQDGSGRVAVRLRHNPLDNVLEIEVADNGPGLPPEALGRVFDPFFSLRAAGRRLGMGLTIAFRLVELNGGQIELSNGERGAVAVLTIPVETAGR